MKMLLQIDQWVIQQYETD